MTLEKDTSIERYFYDVYLLKLTESVEEKNSKDHKNNEQ